MLSQDRYVVLSAQEMARVDQMTISTGIAGVDLMERAGLAVVRHIMARYREGKTCVLCGPGNNGGDGFVIARLLKKAGWEVEVALLGKRVKLCGDAAVMAGRWSDEIAGVTVPLTPKSGRGCPLVVDALFGSGLSRPVTGRVARVIERINSSDSDVVAVDVPSGVDGNSGQIRGEIRRPDQRPDQEPGQELDQRPNQGGDQGVAFRASSTVTFFREKPGHLLYPGKEYCGEVTVADIGTPVRLLREIHPRRWRNDPALWRRYFPRLAANSHKYNRGHAVVISGDMARGGAARLAARAALRIGAGLVSVACPQESIFSHAAQLTAVMIKDFSGEADIESLLADERLNGWCVGPGGGVTGQTKSHVLKIVAAGRHCVIDADGLNVFSYRPETLFAAIKKSGQMPILTPHEGEFSRLFPDIAIASQGGNKINAAREAADKAQAVIIYKGADTVIASPDGRVVINDNAPPTLATAGSGDVLAGLCLGLLSQGMKPFEAACAAVWIHGAAAAAFGPGLISEDIEGQIPAILKYILETGD